MYINIIRSTNNFTLYIEFTHLPPLRAIGYNCCHPKKHIYNKISRDGPIPKFQPIPIPDTDT